MNSQSYYVNSFKEGKISTNEVFDKIFLSGKRRKLQNNAVDEVILSNSIAELNSLIGLNNVKTLVDELLAYSDIQRKRRENGLNTEPMALHMVFKGNPGTGKTTIARLLGRIFKGKGLLETGHLVEIERADLVGEYIGHTAQKARDQIKKALGGILFIDEAYSLARGGEKDFGKEAIDALVKGMEDHKDNLILILAGYKDEMDSFIKTNPGLKSRFPIHMIFDDYSLEDLLEIAELMLEKRQYKISLSGRAKLSQILASKRARDGIHSGNARLVRNLIESSIRKQAVRLKTNKGDHTIEDLMMLTREDFIEY